MNPQLLVWRCEVALRICIQSEPVPDVLTYGEGSALRTLVNNLEAAGRESGVHHVTELSLSAATIKAITEGVIRDEHMAVPTVPGRGRGGAK